MRGAPESLRETGVALARGLRDPRFYLALLLGLLLWAFAYQNKRDYVIQVADLAYHPYISNFNDIETSTAPPTFRYRWSKANPRVFLPGIGNQPVQVSITTIGSRPGAPPPELTVRVRGQTFTLQTRPEQHTETFLVGRGNPWDGNFTLDMSVPAFSPPGDPRELGVIIKEIAIRPGDYGLRPVVIPALDSMGLLLVGGIASYLFGLITTRRRSFALLLVISCVMLAALGIVAVRPDVGFLAGQQPTGWAWGLLFALIGRTLLEVVLRPRARWAGFVAAAGSAAFAATFMIRFGGLTYAQFLTSDLFLHIHNTESVLRGEWLFTEPVPDGTLVPYPPAHYALLSALSWLVGSSEQTLGLLLKWSASLLDAAACLGMAWAGWRLMPGAFGGMAALAYACSPAAFDLFSAGNYTNIFAQSVLNLTLLGGLAFLNSKREAVRSLGPALLAAGFGLTMLGHYGMMLGTLPVLAIFALWTGISSVRGKPTGNAVWLLGAATVALVGSIALYYWHFTTEIRAQWTGLLGKLQGSQLATPRSPATSGPGYLQALLKLPNKLFDLVGGLIVITALFGAASFARISTPARALLASWLLAVALFALLNQVVGDSVRWYYQGAALTGLLAGGFLTQLVARGSWARALCALLLAAMALYMLAFWTTLIFTRYH